MDSNIDGSGHSKIFPQDIEPRAGFRLHYMMLYSLVYGLEAKHVFEFGCGHSSRVILDALKETGGTLTTVEKREIKDTGNDPSMLEEEKDRWRYVQKLSGDALKEDIKGDVYDLVLHDGAHEPITVMKDIRAVVKHMKQGAILLVHDTNHSWYKYLPLAIRLGLFPRRYEVIRLPYGYGLTVIRLKSNMGNGRVVVTSIK